MAGRDRAVDGLESILPEDAVVAPALAFEEPAIGCKVAQFGKIVQALSDPEVIGVVDGGPSAQGAIFLLTLLDARVLVIDVQGRGHTVRRGCRTDPMSGSGAVSNFPSVSDHTRTVLS